MTIENRILEKGFILQEELEDKRFIYSSNIEYHTKQGNYCLYYNPKHDWVLIWIADLEFGAFVVWDNDKVQTGGSTLFAGKIKRDKELLAVFKCVGL